MGRRNQLLLAFAGGANNAPHGDLDIGNFVFDALGTRWVYDYGFDNYGQANYFNTDPTLTPNRWHYFRKRAEAHNTYVVNPTSGPDQDPNGVAPITQVVSKTGEAFGTVDMKAAFPQSVGAALRGFKLFQNRKYLLVQDELDLLASTNTLHWFLQIKEATETVGSRTYTSGAQLLEGGKKVVLSQEVDRWVGGVRQKVTVRTVVKILAPTNAAFVKENAAPLSTSPNPVNQDTNSRYRRLRLTLENLGPGPQTIAVALMPYGDGESEPNPALSVVPLSGWQ